LRTKTRARLKAQSAGEKGQRTRQEVIFSVVKAYTEEFLSKETVRVGEAAVKAAQSDLDRAQARQEEGHATACRWSSWRTFP
jgi:outer membrane protein TolC